MNYTREEFFRLLEAVEEQGGEHLDEVHEHSMYEEFTGGQIHDVQQGYIKNCGESVLFTIPYESFLVTAGPDDSVVKVCAKDDWVGRWPRFAAANAKGR